MRGRSRNAFAENGHLWNAEGGLSVGRTDIEKELSRFMLLIEFFEPPEVIDTLRLRGVTLSIVEWKPSVSLAKEGRAAFRILVTMEGPASLIASAHLIQLTPGSSVSQ
jgi:hypothetical protein